MRLPAAEIISVVMAPVAVFSGSFLREVPHQIVSELVAGNVEAAGIGGILRTAQCRGGDDLRRKRFDEGLPVVIVEEVNHEGGFHGSPCLELILTERLAEGRREASVLDVVDRGLHDGDVRSDIPVETNLFQLIEYSVKYSARHEPRHHVDPAGRHKEYVVRTPVALLGLSDPSLPDKLADGVVELLDRQIPI